MTDQERATFQDTVWEWYRQRGRHDLSWRQPDPDGSFNAYKILVSEMMLQQTQVTRVAPKYQEFLAIFPTVFSLAASELGEVLRAWQGLGYNRRAQYLWRAAQDIVRDYQGVFPRTIPELIALPGIGKNTAGAILAYAYNQPVIFVETNIRTVFIYHFFSQEAAVSDAAIAECVAATLPEDDTTREWYWALMDYGTSLKQTVGNVNNQSRTYTKQSKFRGSRRQLRGQVLRLLTDGPKTKQQLEGGDDERLPGVLDDLEREGLIRQQNGRYQI